MKNVLVIVFFLVGTAYSSLQAQACKPADCAPCPPGCCIIKCCPPNSGSASASLTDLSPNAMFASMPAESKEACNGQKMSKKEMKSCMAACTKSAAATKTATNCQVTTACGSQAASEKIVHTASADIKH
jgi:hypothetical protein